MIDLHVRLPAETKERVEQMADAAAPKGKRGNLGVWVTALIEAEWERQAKKGADAWRRGAKPTSEPAE